MYVHKMRILNCCMLAILPAVVSAVGISSSHPNANFLFRFFENFDSVRDKISPNCNQSYDYFLHHQQEEWAQTMIDANAVEEPGRAWGNLQLLGNYDECIPLKMPSDAPVNDGRIQFCSVHFPAELVMNQEEIKQFAPFTFVVWQPTAGICLPAACSAEHDLPIIFNQLMRSQRRCKTVYNDDSCLPSEHIKVIGCTIESDLELANRIQPIHLVIGSIFLLVLILTAMGTVFESILTTNQKSRFLSRFFLCFGLQRNIEFLFRTRPYVLQKNPASGQIDCLHGIRSLSIIFVLTYHVFTEASIPCANFLELLNIRYRFIFQMVTNATAWVDTYLLVGGFVLAHSWLRKPDPNPTSFWAVIAGHPRRIWHRYLRLTPSVAAVLGIYILIEVLGSGPLWDQYVKLSRGSCHQNWWGIFLYINNICNLNTVTNPQRECLSFLWYLAVDMQCFLVSPLLLVFLAHPSRSRRRIGILINLAVILASLIITGTLMYMKHMPPTVLMNVMNLLDYINLVYKTSYCRIGPYCIGILLAYFLRQRETKQQERSLVRDDTEGSEEPAKDNCRPGNPRTGLMLLMTSMALMFGSLMLTYPWLQGASYDTGSWAVLAIIYGSLYRCVWALGWALLIWAMVRRHLILLDRIFSHQLCQLTSKLSYQTYLLHSVLISAVVNSTRRTFYYTDFGFALDVIRYFFFTQFVCIMTYVLIERPFINLESMFFDQRSGHRVSGNKHSMAESDAGLPQDYQEYYMDQFKPELNPTLPSNSFALFFYRVISFFQSIGTLTWVFFGVIAGIIFLCLWKTYAAYLPRLCKCDRFFSFKCWRLENLMADFDDLKKPGLYRCQEYGAVEYPPDSDEQILITKLMEMFRKEKEQYY